MTENVVRHPLNMTQYTSFQNLYPDEVLGYIPLDELEAKEKA